VGWRRNTVAPHLQLFGRGPYQAGDGWAMGEASACEKKADSNPAFRRTDMVRLPAVWA
jgi:hypothetical protein